MTIAQLKIEIFKLALQYKVDPDKILVGFGLNAIDFYILDEENDKVEWIKTKPITDG